MGAGSGPQLDWYQKLIGAGQSVPPAPQATLNNYAVELQKYQNIAGQYNSGMYNSGIYQQAIGGVVNSQAVNHYPAESMRAKPVPGISDFSLDELEQAEEFIKGVKNAPLDV